MTTTSSFPIEVNKIHCISIQNWVICHNIDFAVITNHLGSEIRQVMWKLFGNQFRMHSLNLASVQQELHSSNRKTFRSDYLSHRLVDIKTPHKINGVYDRRRQEVSLP